MDMMPLPRVQVSHPAWCVGAHTDAAEDTDPKHRSVHEPMVLTDDDFLVSASLYRADEVPPGPGRQRVNDPGIELKFVSKHGGTFRFDPLFTPAEARHLAGVLERLAEQAERETAEVVW